jgi:hypothetical protein
MKKIDKKAQPIQYRGEVKELIKNYDLEMKVVSRVPKVFYSMEGKMIKTEK